MAEEQSSYYDENISLEGVGQIVGRKLPGKVEKNPSTNTSDSDEIGEEGFNYPVEILNTLTAPSGLPYRKLTVKIGFPVVLLRSIDSFKKHFNGVLDILKNTDSNIFLLEALAEDNGIKVLPL